MNLDAVYAHIDAYPHWIVPTLRGLRPSFKICSFATLASTQQTLRQLAAAGAPAGSAVVAATQTAGRGQQGRVWQSVPGGLYLSLLLMPDWPVARAAQLTLAGGYGVCELLQQAGLPVALKWPNDLVVRAAVIHQEAQSQGNGLLKLGGILTETRTRGDRVTQALIGVGLNVTNPVPETGTSLSRLGSTSPDLLEWATATVLMGLWQGLCWRQQVETETFLRTYRSRLAHLGQSISVGGVTGRIADVDAGGCLLIETAVGVLRAHPGEVALGYDGEN